MLLEEDLHTYTRLQKYLRAQRHNHKALLRNIGSGILKNIQVTQSS